MKPNPQKALKLFRRKMASDEESRAFSAPKKGRKAGIATTHLVFLKQNLHLQLNVKFMALLDQ